MGCAPLSVGISTQANHDFWEITIENGDRITVQRNDNPFASVWSIEYEHNGQSTSSTSENPTSFEWPSLLFEDGGVYDVHVAVIDEFGCEAETTYTDAIEVWPGGDFSDLTSNIVNACDSGGVSVHVESTNNRAISWLWTFSDGSTSNEQSATHYFGAPFNYTDGISTHLLVTDSNGCASSRDIVFEAVLPAVPSFSWNAPPVCRGEDVFFSNTSLAPSNTTYQWSFGDNSTSTEADSLVHAYAMNGTYAVCLTATNSAGCATQWCDPNTIDVYSPVATTEFTTVLNTCLFAVNLENTSTEGGDYTWWDFGDNQTGIGDTVLHTYPIGVYDVSLVIGANNGCADTLIIEDILNYSSSVGPFTQVLDTANCAPFGVSFQAFNPNDQLFDYFWDFNDGNGDPFGGTTSSHAYTEPGEYCPSIMMTDPNGCDVYIHCTDTIVVENYAAVALLPEHLCSGEQGIVTVLNTENLQWTHPWVSQGAQSGQLLVEADTSFSFELTAHYSDCVHQQTIEVEILPLPSVALALVDSVCANTGALMLMGGFPEGETGFYTIDGVGVNALNTELYSGEYVLTRYSYMGPNGCSNTAIDSIYIIALPYVETLVDRSFCEADSSLLLDGATNTHFTVDGIEAQDFPFTYTGSASNVTLHVYDNFGCYNHSSAQYMVHATPRGVIDSHDVCANEEVHVNAAATVSGSTIHTILWAVDSLYSGVGNSVSNLSFTYGGEHSAVFTVESNEGCVARIDTTFMVFDIPNAAFESSVACEKDTTVINDISTFGNDSIAFWNWSYDDVALQSSGDTLIVFNNAGVTNLTLQVVTQHGCVDHAERSVVVRYAPILTAHADSHCLGEATHFESTASIPSGGISLTEWSIEGVPYPMVGAAASYEFNEAANYSYTFGAVSNFGCRSEVVDSVWVYAIPEVSLPVDEFTYCVNQQAGVLANVAVGGPSDIAGLLWTIDGEVVSEGNPGQFSLDELGAYVLDVEVTSTHGCVARATLDQPIVVYPGPTAGFTWNIDQLTDNPSVVVSPATSADVVEINYSWGDGTTDGANQHVYAADGEYEITQVVSNVFGCNAYHSETIEAYNGLQFYIPTAFTPDQNNYNETFYPVVTGSNITYYAFRVFNRWGNEVFTSTIPGEGWDGTFKGEPAQDGAYNWSVDMIVRGRADLFVKKGSVLLMR
jgi:gliding motility-associated-like protein